MTSEPASGEPPTESQRIISPGLLIRLRGLALMLPCSGLLVVAATLTPSGDGYGTHTDLNLPPCGFLLRTGYPCPTCGMTTAFAEMMHGHFIMAMEAQPFGALLTVVAACLALTGLGELVAGRSVLHRLRPGYWWLWAGLGGLFVGWGLKIAIGLAMGTLPVR